MMVKIKERQKGDHNLKITVKGGGVQLINRKV